MSSWTDHPLHNTAGPFLRRWAGLTLDVHQGADVGAAHGVGYLAGDGICEVGVVHRHLQAVSVGLRDGDPSFGPPGQRWIHHITRLRGGVSPCASSRQLSVGLELAAIKPSLLEESVRVRSPFAGCASRDGLIHCILYWKRYLYPVISGLAEAEQMNRTLAPSVTVWGWTDRVTEGGSEGEDT